MVRGEPLLKSHPVTAGIGQYGKINRRAVSAVSKILADSETYFWIKFKKLKIIT